MQQIPRGTLWLHVGTHKTGTTSIQEALDRKRDVLLAEGIALHPEKNAYRLANLFLRSSIKSTPRVGGNPLPTLRYMDEAIAQITSARGHHPDMIISSEEFCLLRDPVEGFALRAALSGLFDQIIPILMIRNETEWRSSRADQLRKTGNYDLQRALPNKESTDGTWYYAIEEIVNFWSAIGPLQKIDYDIHSDNILPVFAKIIGKPEIFDDINLRLNIRS